ncbi:MAG: hypothetical protein IJU64_07345 [Bacilli bacterium]|nr:hypothetical protein [Bacilli bacterium]
MSYATSDNLSHELISANAEHSAKAAYRLGCRWLITASECLIKAIESLDSPNSSTATKRRSHLSFDDETASLAS